MITKKKNLNYIFNSIFSSTLPSSVNVAEDSGNVMCSWSSLYYNGKNILLHYYICDLIVPFEKILTHTQTQSE